MIKPQRIRVQKDAQLLTIEWDDDHVSTFPLDGLRRACPCAGCQGHDNMGTLPEREIFLVPALLRWDELKLKPVGNYAIQFTWDDGHDTGIYTWKSLRAMCPCDDCSI